MHTINSPRAKWLVSLIILLLAGCSRAPAPQQPEPYAPEPDRHISGSAVTLDMHLLQPLQVGPRSSQMFLDMLTNVPSHVDFTGLSAAPMGVFAVGGTNYFWHGNAVVRGRDHEVRLWSGPYVQRLINDVARNGYRTEDIQSILDAIESDPNVIATPMDGLGAYPRPDQR